MRPWVVDEESKAQVSREFSALCSVFSAIDFRASPHTRLADIKDVRVVAWAVHYEAVHTGIPGARYATGTSTASCLQYMLVFVGRVIRPGSAPMLHVYMYGNRPLTSQSCFCCGRC